MMKNQTLLIIFSVLLIVLGTIGLILLQKPLRENSFDLRRQAAEIKTCNEVCSSNAECEVNHFCHQNRCRLADNPGDEKCQGVPDQGLNFSCDQYCADSKECGAEFVCLKNKCRLPNNPDDQWCRYMTNATPPATAAAGRLFKPTPLPKGGAEATLSATLVSTESATPAAIIKPLPTPRPTPSLAPILPEEKTALDSLLNSLRRAGVPVNFLPIIALVTGGLILLIVFIPKLFTKNKLNISHQAQSTPNSSQANSQTQVNPAQQVPPQTLATSVSPPTQAPPPPPTPVSPHTIKPKKVKIIKQPNMTPPQD